MAQLTSAAARSDPPAAAVGRADAYALGEGSAAPVRSDSFTALTGGLSKK